MSPRSRAVDTGRMPTAEEFRHVAGLLDDARLELDTLATLVAELAGGLILVGPVQAAVDSTIGVSAANIRSAVIELELQANEARRRAAVCDAYTGAYRRFVRSDAADLLPPRRPASWVRYG